MADLNRRGFLRFVRSAPVALPLAAADALAAKPEVPVLEPITMSRPLSGAAMVAEINRRFAALRDAIAGKGANS